MLTGKHLAVIGGGKMGGIITRGIITRKLLPAKSITITDIDSDRLEELRTSLGVLVCSDNAKAVAKADIVILAVKPQVFPQTLAAIRPVVKPAKLFISVAAGLTTETIEKALGSRPRVIRVMPNVNALSNEGAAAACEGAFAKPDDMAVALQIFNAVGLAVALEEKLMDAVTGLSGSGPAYCFVIIEALADAGVSLGLPRDLAEKLAAQTLLGSGRLCLEGGQHPAQLKNMVTSPGGTTAAGLKALEQGKIRATLMSAVEASAKRAQELSSGK